MPRFSSSSPNIVSRRSRGFQRTKTAHVMIMLLILAMVSIFVYVGVVTSGPMAAGERDDLRASPTAQDAHGVVVEAAADESIDITTDVTNTVGKATSRHAYAFLMAGCNDLEPEGYRGMLNSIMVSCHILQRSGSEADFVLMVVMSIFTNSTQLPEKDADVLQRLNVRIKYLDKFESTDDENFFGAIERKLEVVSLTEYDRVLFLDNDVLPFCSLDYMFILSEGPNSTIKENVILAETNSPANGGFFMVSPQEGDREKIQNIIAQRDERLGSTRDSKFDQILGWGTPMNHSWRVPTEPWHHYGYPHHCKGVRHFKDCLLWDFYNAESDQGLLYHWTMYVKQNVTQLILPEAENWMAGPDGMPVLERNATSLDVIFPREAVCPEGEIRELTLLDKGWGSPYRDFRHFQGPWKPWIKSLINSEVESTLNRTRHFWMDHLEQIQLQLNITLEQAGDKPPSLGYINTKVHFNLRAKKARLKSQIEQ